MRRELLENVMPFWFDRAIDTEYGGIFTCLDREGNIYGEEKSVWFQGRALYILSVVYNTVERDEKYLKAAKAIYDFLPKCGDENGRMAFTVTRDGRPIQKRRYYFSETFAAIACAEYYLATGEQEAKTRAMRYFDIAYDIFSGKIHTPPKFEPDNAQYAALSPCMIMLSTAQVMRKLDKEPYDTIAREMTKEILRHLTDKGLLENIHPNGSFVDTPTGRLVNPGHSLEAAWFLMAEGVYQQDQTLIEKAEEIIHVSMKLGYQNGAILAFCDCDGKPATALEWDMQLWWPQCEAMIANRYAFALTGKQQYLDWYNALKAYTDTHFKDTQHGEWYGYLHYDGTVANTLKGNIFKGPFHIPRMLILLDRIERGEPLI